MYNDNQNARSARLAGGVLIGLAILTVFAMLHHPTTSGHSDDQIASEILAIAPLNQLVHGGMILILVANYAALSVFSEKLGRGRFLPRLAQSTFFMATLAFIGAALTSGFWITEVASQYLDHFPDNPDTFYGELLTLWSANQVLATAASYGTAGAIAVWSFVLLTHTGIVRIAGVVGSLIGLGLIVGMLSGVLGLDVGGMTLIAIGYSIWYALIGFLMLRDKI